MKREMFFRLVLVAGVTTILAACTSESDNSPSAKISYETVAAAQQVPVTFGTYLGETPVTRAAINTTALLQSAGIGVFATYSNGGDYAAATGPNFMWNQSLTYAESKWGYTPIKYWPNETTTDAQSPAATSSHTDKLSFFAYAPYKAATASTGAISGTPSYGITGLTTNAVGTATDPKVTYTTGITLNEDDLLWGVANPAADVTWTSVNGTTTVTVDKGKPFLNLMKPNTTAAVKFYMRHALAGLKLTVQGVYDEVTATTKKLADGTYINIESITITATLPTSGVLNLNNTTANVPLWESNTTTGSKTFTLNTADLEENLRYSSSATSSTIKKGVGRNSEGTAISTAQNVIAQSGGVDRYFMFVPPATSADDITFSFNIVYDVWTYDTALVGEFAKVQNNITKTVTINDVAGGKMYTVNMLLGLTSVKLDADVVPWTDDTSSSVDLPKNN